MPETSMRGLLQDETFVLTVLTSVLAIAGISLIAPALPALASGLSVSSGRAGLLVTAFTLPGILVLPFAGYLSDTFGRNRVMAGGALLIGIGGLLSFLYPEFNAVVAFRVLQGIGYAGVMPITVALIGDRYHGGEETTAQGLRTACNKVGGIGWMVLGGIIAAVGWSYLFLVYALFIPLAALLYVTMPTRAQVRKPLRTYFSEMAVVVEEPKMGLYLSIGFVRFFLKYGILTLLPFLLAARFGLGSSGIGLLMAVMGLGGILSAAAAGAINERFRKTSSVFTALFIVGAAAAVIGATQHLWLVIAMTFLIGAADAGMSPLHKSLLTHNVDSHHRAGIITTNSLGQAVGKTAAPALVSLLLLGSGGMLFVAFGGFAMVSAVSYLHLRNVLAARNYYP